MTDARKEEMGRAEGQNIVQALGAIGDLNNGRILFCPMTNFYRWYGPGMPVSAPQQRYAEILLHKLNKEAWLDGRWAVAWVDLDLSVAEYKRLVMIYMDHEFDVQFTVDIEDDPHTMLANIDEYISQAIEAWKMAAEFKRDVGVNDNETIKAAKGQKSVDPTASPGIDVFSL